jgi:urease accessory protein
MNALHHLAGRRGALVRAVLLLALFPLWPAVAQAHVGEAADGFVSGLLHPVFGLDHFLAMLSVGIVSAQLGGSRVYTVPALFVTAMIGGAAVGWNGREWPLAEAGIAMSVIVLGVGIVLARRDRHSLMVMGMVAFFGCLHGHAHGLEMPKASDPVYYAAGFVLSTVAIHLLGVLIGWVFTARALLMPVLRHMGSGAAGMGVVLLVNALKTL